MKWPALPFVRLILPLGLGILLGTCRIGTSIYLVAIAFALLFSILLGCNRSRLPFEQRRWFGRICFTCLLSLGWLLTYYHTDWHHPHHLRRYTDGITTCRLRVMETRTLDKWVRISAEIEAAVDSTGAVRFPTGKLLAYLPRDRAANELSAGDRLWARAEIEPVPALKNPLAFDFAAYLSKKNIYHQIFLSGDAWKRAPSETPVTRLNFHSLRESCLAQLSRRLPDTSTLSIAAALILGRRDLISTETREAYTATGAIHVLAVSGLHVGMIYLGFGWILSAIGGRGRSRRWLRAMLLLTAVWSYALFTGGSASVLRAASMFSFMILGEALFRQGQIYNTLAASAFVLLCIDPYLLLDIGFQLSYLAVIGIVFFQPRIYRACYIPNRFGNYLWKLAAVSIAAQLTTLPISLFYFHQFPTYFWLSGWIVVPAAMIILATGLLLLLCSPITAVADLLGELLNLIIGWMNRSIFWIEQLPGALIDGIWLNGAAVCLLYLALAALMLGLYRKRLQPLRWSLLLLLTVGSWNNLRIIRADRQLVLTVYCLYRGSAIDLFEGRRAYALMGPSVEPGKLAGAADNFRAFHHIRQVEVLRIKNDLETPRLLKKGPILLFDNQRIGLIDGITGEPPPKPIHLDYIIVYNNPRLNMATLQHYFKAGQIVFDASNHPRQVQNWKAECDRYGLAYHDVNEAGAWTIRAQ